MIRIMFTLLIKFTDYGHVILGISFLTLKNIFYPVLSVSNFKWNKTTFPLWIVYLQENVLENEYLF